MTDWQQIAEDNLRAYEAALQVIVLRDERLRVLTEAARAASEALYCINDELGGPSPCNDCAFCRLRGVLDDPPPGFVNEPGE